jgi:hypothetical protein
MFSLYLAAPFIMLLGLYLLVRCIANLWKIIFPKVSHRFPASSEPYRFSLPEAGRYIINVVIPPLSFIPGISHFSARFDITTSPPPTSLPYHSYGRSLFQARRSDMAGRMSVPLGSFECAAPAQFEVRCLNPETIRPNFQLEISPYVSPLLLVSLILATILTFAMMGFGLIFSILWLASLR